MKEIKVAEHSGFCFGVKRAIEKTEEQLSKEGRALICGSLIHNKTVTADIVSRGGKIIHSLDEAGPGDTVIVRSHGEGARCQCEILQSLISVGLAVQFKDNIVRFIGDYGNI